MREFYEDERTQGFFTDLLNMIDSSGMFLLLVPPDEAIDLKVCVELGIAIMLDKPILALVPLGRKLPSHLTKIVVDTLTLRGDSQEDARAIADVIRRRSLS